MDVNTVLHGGALSGRRAVRASLTEGARAGVASGAVAAGLRGHGAGPVRCVLVRDGPVAPSVNRPDGYSRQRAGIRAAGLGPVAVDQ
jgi:hypothetical protein